MSIGKFFIGIADLFTPSKKKIIIGKTERQRRIASTLERIKYIQVGGTIRCLDIDRDILDHDISMVACDGRVFIVDRTSRYYCECTRVS